MPQPSTDPWILVIEDNPALLALLTQLCEREGFHARGVGDAAAGLRAALADTPALVVLDLGLPDGDGITLTAELRQRGLDCPILMLTARDAERDRVAGLEAGADDYLVKPFDATELLARVRALLRRVRRPADDEPTVLRQGGLALDILHRTVSYGERTIALTQREYSLLAVLMRCPGRTLSRERLAQEAWQHTVETLPARNSIDVYVAYLRRKLEAAGVPPLLHTVRGEGYVFRTDDGAAAPPTPVVAGHA